MYEVLDEILKRSIQIETNMATIYRFFSTVFPDDALLLDQLAVEEDGHARVLEALKEKVVKAGVLPDFVQYDLEALDHVNKMIENALDLYKREIPDRQAAFLFLLDMEESTGEAHHQLVLDKSAETIAGVFEELKTYDLDHAERIRMYLQARP